MGANEEDNEAEDINEAEEANEAEDANETEEAESDNVDNKSLLDGDSKFVIDIKTKEEGSLVVEKVMGDLKHLNAWLKGLVSYWDKKVEESGVITDEMINNAKQGILPNEEGEETENKSLVTNNEDDGESETDEAEAAEEEEAIEGEEANANEDDADADNVDEVSGVPESARVMAEDYKLDSEEYFLSPNAPVKSNSYY